LNLVLVARLRKRLVGWRDSWRAGG